jgi:hypothetical protein
MPYPKDQGDEVFYTQREQTGIHHCYDYSEIELNTLQAGFLPGKSALLLPPAFFPTISLGI